MADETFNEWCIVELLGHRRLAGYVREVQLAGAGFLRLDIPESGTDPARTQYISPGSLYALHPVSESTARAAAASWRPEPVRRWELPAVEEPKARVTPGPGDLRHYDEDDDDDLWGHPEPEPDPTLAGVDAIKGGETAAEETDRHA